MEQQQQQRSKVEQSLDSAFEQFKAKKTTFKPEEMELTDEGAKNILAEGELKLKCAFLLRLANMCFTGLNVIIYNMFFGKKHKIEYDYLKMTDDELEEIQPYVDEYAPVLLKYLPDWVIPFAHIESIYVDKMISFTKQNKNVSEQPEQTGKESVQENTPKDTTDEGKDNRRRV